MEEEFQPPLDAEQRSRRCIQANNHRVADERITAPIELVKALTLKFIQNYRAGVGFDGDPSEILKGLDGPSNLRPQLAIVWGYGAYSDLDVAFLICAKFVCCSFPAPNSLGVIVFSRKEAKIATRVNQIRF